MSTTEFHGRSDFSYDIDDLKLRVRVLENVLELIEPDCMRVVRRNLLKAEDRRSESPLQKSDCE